MIEFNVFNQLPSLEVLVEHLSLTDVRSLSLLNRNVCRRLECETLFEHHYKRRFSHSLSENNDWPFDFK
jgi:hypothetical protein